MVKVDFLFCTFYCNYSVWLKITIWLFFKATIVSSTINTIRLTCVVTPSHRQVLCKALSSLPWDGSEKT